MNEKEMKKENFDEESNQKQKYVKPEIKNHPPVQINTGTGGGFIYYY